MMRARVYSGMTRGLIRTWFNMYAATPGTVAGQKAAEGNPAQNPATNYVALFRHGSHQSGTRAWLRPTQMTETLTRKNYFGQVIDVGFEADVHSVSGAPKEAFVKIERAEDGGTGAAKLWRPVTLGLRPESASPSLLAYLKGDYITQTKGS